MIIPLDVSVLLGWHGLPFLHSWGAFSWVLSLCGWWSSSSPDVAILDLEFRKVVTPELIFRVEDIVEALLGNLDSLSHLAAQWGLVG